MGQRLGLRDDRVKFPCSVVSPGCCRKSVTGLFPARNCSASEHNPTTNKVPRNAGKFTEQSFLGWNPPAADSRKDSELEVHLGQFIGQGSSSDVHAFGNSQVVKIFQSRFSISEVQTEVAGLRIANAHGVPSPSAGDIVTVDNKYGIVLERIDGQRLADYVRIRPWMVWSGARIYAELYAKIHRCQAPEMPSQRELLLEEIESNRFLSQEETRSILARLDRLQDKQALCLGDFSP